MHRIIATFLFIIVSSIVRTQSLTFEIGASQNNFRMERVNQLFLDSFALKPQNNLFGGNLNKGNYFQFIASYRPKRLFDFGIYIGYQNGSLKGFPVAFETDLWGNVVAYHRGCAELMAQSYSFGLSGVYYFSELLNFQEKETTLNRVHLGLELMGGYGFASVENELYFPTFEDHERVFTQHRSQAFQGQLGLKIEYDFIKNPLITSLGIRSGYQYFRTGNVKNKLNEEWIVLEKYPMNLDFSGFYFGVYLKLGR